MSFTNDFNEEKSSFEFKNRLTSDKYNLFLKQPSLVNYSLINVLSNFYNKFETTPNVLGEISLNTKNDEMQDFLDNTLKNLMYKTLFDNVLVNNMYLEDVTDAISFKLEKPSYNINNPMNVYNEVKINIENPLSVTLDSEKGIKLHHKQYRNEVERCGMLSGISGDNLYEQKIKIPVLVTEENGHIKNCVEKIYGIPNPTDVLRRTILSGTNINPGESISIGEIQSNEDIDLILNYRYVLNGYIYKACASKYLSVDMLSLTSTESIIVFTTKEIRVQSSFPYLLSMVFKIQYTNNPYYPNKKILKLTFLNTYGNKNLNYSNLLQDFSLKAYAITNY